MQVRKFLMMSVLSLLLLPATAHAQSWFFTPYIGGNFAASISSPPIVPFGSNQGRTSQRR